MTLDEWETGYLRACGAAVRAAVQGVVNAFPQVAEHLSNQGYTCVLVLDDGCVNVGLDPDFCWKPETAEEVPFLERLQDDLYALSTMTLVNAMANKDLDAYEGCYIEFPLIED